LFFPQNNNILYVFGALRVLALMQHSGYIHSIRYRRGLANKVTFLLLRLLLLLFIIIIIIIMLRLCLSAGQGSGKVDPAQL